MIFSKTLAGDPVCALGRAQNGLLQASGASPCLMITIYRYGHVAVECGYGSDRLISWLTDD